MFSSPEFRKIAQKITPKGKFKLLSASKVCQLASPKLLLSLSPCTAHQPFLSAKTSTTLPRGHELRGEFSALTRTKSPTARFLRIVVHFCLLWSRVHRRTCENDPISFHKTSPMAYLKRTKTINRCKRWLTWVAIHGMVSHFLLTERALTSTTTKTLRKNFPDNRTCVYAPKLQNFKERNDIIVD